MPDSQDQHANERRAAREQARQEELRQRDENDRLQAALVALEQGEPLAQAFGLLRAGPGLENPPGRPDLQELEELVRLAAALRAQSHPVSQVGWAEQRAILAARGGLPASPLPPGNGRYISPGRMKPMSSTQVSSTQDSNLGAWPEQAPRRAGSGRERTAPAWNQPFTRHPARLLAGLAVLLLLAASLAGLGLYRLGPGGARAATLMESGGLVEIQTQAGTWQALSDGEQVHSGQRLRTGRTARATLVFFDGTRTTLGPESEVTLAQVSGGWGRVLRVNLVQARGRTEHSVVPLRGNRSAFTVLTPSGAASVHGTHFDVAVDQNGAARFGVETGRVLVSSELSEVFLTAGQATAAQPDGVLEDPAYQFTLLGGLTASQGSTWIVDGVPFSVTPQTAIAGFDLDGPQVGDLVRVAGRVLAGGEWIADRIELAAETGASSAEEKLSTFTGVLEANTGGVWQIGGWTVQVDADTQLGADLTAGTPVRVTFRLIEDGRWLAVRIEPLVDPADTPPATETPPTGPAAQPVLSFSPSEVKAQICGAGELSLPASLANLATGAENTAENVELAAQVVEGAQYVEWVEIDPAKVDRIEAGGVAGLQLRLALTAGWEAAEDGEVKLRVFTLGGQTAARLTIKVENECEETETEAPQETPVVTQPIIATEPLTPTITATPEVTATLPVTTTLPITSTETLTPTITVTPTVTPTITATLPVTTTVATNCTGAQPHPTGMRIAQHFGVPYEEIMGWFCQGFGFGEIELAYSLSWVSGRPVAEIFAMKSGGMGWGEIKKQLGTRGNPKKWATPPPDGSSPGSPGVQATPQPPGNSGKPKPPKPPKPNKP